MLESGFWWVWVIVLSYSLRYVTVWEESGLGYVLSETFWAMLQSGLCPVWVVSQSGLCHSLCCNSLFSRQSGICQFWDEGSLGY